MQPAIYDTITAQIVAAIEAGAATYRMPWHRSRYDVASPTSLESGKPYRGINTLALWASAEARGYASGIWGTYRQWQAAGAQVRKGEKAAPVVFWKDLRSRSANGAAGGSAADTGAGDAVDGSDGEADPRRRFVARGYSVFNADQVDGYTPPALPVLPESERIAAAEAFLASVPATIQHGRSSACYVPAIDRVQMPPFGQFASARGYYATLAHELTHWSGASLRLNRDLSGRFGSEAYAMEELIAELGAAFTMTRLGLAGEPRTDHAPYIASWLRVLKNDSRAIFTAAAKAEQAADYLAGFGVSPG